MTLSTLLYVSSSVLKGDVAAADVRHIVATSLTNNPLHELTGALLFTGTHFAQVLEGYGAEIDRLMRKLEQDTRHEALIVVDRRFIDTRRFPKWDMAYCGPSQFVAGHVSRLLDDPGRSEKARAAAWLSDLMFEFVKH